VTVRVVEPLTPLEDAWIVLVPVDTVLAKPEELMVATDVADDVKVAVLVKFCWLLSEYVPVAVNCWVFPSGTEGFAGVTAMDVSVITVKLAPLLAFPPTVTTTLPVVAPEGTGTLMLVELQLVGAAVVPLKVTVLVPCVLPNVVPVMVTDVPIRPDAGERLVMAGVTVKLLPLLALPPTVTTTLPVVAAEGTGALILVELQLLGVAVVPLNLTVLVPCVLPKVVPAMVTDVPTGPDVGERLVMAGVTVKLTPLLALPDTVTTTLPDVAAEGTVATILVELQLVTAAVVLLNLTVLLPWLVPKLDPLMVTEAPTVPEVGDRLVMLGAAKDFVVITATSIRTTVRNRRINESLHS
jgi:hypothetical protein